MDSIDEFKMLQEITSIYDGFVQSKDSFDNIKIELTNRINALESNQYYNDNVSKEKKDIIGIYKNKLEALNG